VTPAIDAKGTGTMTSAIANGGNDVPVAPAQGGNKMAGRVNLLFGVIAAALAAVSAYLALATSPPLKSLFCDPATHDFGTVRQGALLKTSFTLTNQGPKAIEIVSLLKSCTCTEAKALKQRLEPGETTSIDVGIKVGAARRTLSSSVHVTYCQAGDEKDKSNNKTAVVGFEAVASISPDVACEPEVLTFFPSTTNRKTLRVFSQWLKGPLIKKVYARHRAFQVKAQDDGTHVEITFDPSLWPKDENLLSELVISTPSKVQSELRIPIQVVETENGA
jgi:uncharacterized protein DUF1573